MGETGSVMAVDIRASQALKLLHEVNLALVRDSEQDLSARQLTILLTVYLEPPPHTVRGLAAKLNVTKPAITRALDTLGSLRLLSRKRDEADKRNVIITRTVVGALYLEQLGDLVVEKAKELPR
ncbi:DNA-binding MarR family transcriptional regulator [Labrenzia sp. EL_208]|nr:DNA-binding MarR family transcriptional regulator [Labrenzia sp. EL_142]MBG6154721.1 DNA-binding MarR family transcriptional regulator [Labrenzia sp. EL_162]MBG6161999.1 DNA-binding MarR family transcriptional regulator [Labrenzia sp. EL_195]MBG6176244.1 DNA-binding MarR family transcriptional regulator [Labrenzia sp. EL_132]MBG6193149.1 DNA-binding MarR family transcriptional regulator [Labrenzia sp. EL_159]MBG6231288.1 DNA-binding MarR family transcriptional regulator [Labrenzia sp. EL_20